MKKTYVWPDVVGRDPYTVMFVDDEFLELNRDQDPEELRHEIEIEALERQRAEEIENEMDCPLEYDADLELKGLKELEYEKKLAAGDEE